MLVWRRSNDWMALLVSLMLLGFGPMSSIINMVLLSRWFGPALASSIVNFTSQINVTIVVPVFFLFFPSATQSLTSGILYFSALISLVIAQVYRFRHVSTLAQRQQTKWVVYSLAVTIILGIGLYAIPALIFRELGPNGSLFSSVANILANVLLILLPISFGVAILRYRLWDVDVLINKTLVYGLLTGTLVAVYAGCIVGLQALLQGLFHQTSEIAIVVSTLLIAALFHPLRQRIQLVIDRRFYRRKYDAARTLAAFSATLHQEVDLNELSEQLVAVVQETMQPSHISLWLRPPATASKQSAAWGSTPPPFEDGKKA